ncbi:MAG: 50S ribosomal protein L29 [candidate division NC10 bacterium]|jgi:large subunit ribosomal protein L29|uniref:Large ribosomal subunit protein uL29 n=1 Tax=uncultured bacterium Rifle_16ft_4_minimus_28965 TaxID=1665156 RepID=A0A0H4TWC1_9BACT|nr:50S ribosomal protein L29, large subunit ribosomal protein L29 [uncultured bacterium Rifle_16ft_4_minimus_28965]MDZ4339688.1 50S ribosomal protein L29 [candidate division NC10 bacterium]
MTKARELRELSTEELQQKRSDLRDDLFRLKMRKAVAQLEAPIRLRQLRRDIARIETLLAERAAPPGPGEVT